MHSAGYETQQKCQYLSQVSINVSSFWNEFNSSKHELGLHWMILVESDTFHFTVSRIENTFRLSKKSDRKRARWNYKSLTLVKPKLQLTVVSLFINMAENGNMWKSDYPKRHFYLLGVAGLLLSIAIIVLEV